MEIDVRQTKVKAKRNNQKIAETKKCIAVIFGTFTTCVPGTCM